MLFLIDFKILIYTFLDEIHLAKQKSKADADFYKTQQEAAANNLLLTPAYLELKKYEALANNNKIYYGESIPQMFFHSEAAMSTFSDSGKQSAKSSTKS